MLAAPDGPDPPGHQPGRPLFVPPGAGTGGIKAAGDPGRFEEIMRRRRIEVVGPPLT
jgi:hypothetical protein